MNESLLTPAEQDLVDAVKQPDNQGESLRTRDYIALVAVTVLIPILLVLLGALT